MATNHNKPRTLPASTEVVDETPSAPSPVENAEIETEQHDNQRDRISQRVGNSK